MTIRRLLPAIGGALLFATALTSAQMPDARQMSGIPMPSADLKPGSVVVRLVRDVITNNIAGHAVELQVGATVLKATTNDGGHAQFDGIAVGTMVKASAVVEGRTVESQSFPVPAGSGIRVVLVAGNGTTNGAPPAALGSPAAGRPGELILGGDSRIQLEFDDDSLTLFYIFDVVNGGAAPISPATELTFDLPEDAQQPTVLEGSSTQATIRGRRVTIAGPFAPGSTPIQIAFGLPPGGASRTLVQSLPIAWARVQVIATMVPGLEMVSSQFTSSGTSPGDTRTFLSGMGELLGAGQPLTVSLSGLPSRSRVSRYATIALAVLILLAGAWAAFAPGVRSAEAVRRTELEQRRGRLMAELAGLEQQQRGGELDAGRFATRRAVLVTQIERVYGELDRQSGPTGEELLA